MSSFDTDVPVLLLRLDRNPFHHGTLGAVRSLGRAGIEVHVFAEPACGPVSRSRYLHRTYTHPQDGAPGVPLLQTLRQISERIGRPAVLIPMDDLSAIAVAHLANRLMDRFLLPAQPAGLPEQVADKAELAGLCRRLGIPHPPTVIPHSAAEAVASAEDLGLPMVAKWSRPWLLPPAAGLRSTTLVRTPDEAQRLYERNQQAGSRLLFQRHLPGGRGTDWFFHGCFTDGAVCLIGGAGRKERSWPVRTGLTAMGRWLPNTEVEDSACRLAGQLGYRGILDLDFRLDSSTGAYHLLDFNPRPGAQFRLFTDRSGLDVVRALHLDLTGRAVPRLRSAPGRIFLVENYAVLSSLASATMTRPPDDRPPAGAAGGVRSTETAWFAADDPVPFLAMAAAWLARGVRKGLCRTAVTRPASTTTLRHPHDERAGTIHV
ncbi:ATP-grasp domain-containing protein [Streptomyces gobiensis]|uniref:carboxylate--amine ligase n=1 Tax=Streptomyces gobiensis TaxID=2875706 RepID=UPI001E2BB657|nr:ATP-grasp domain-containing protein [Streptomyces gobiensis]UGY90533.1 ATP-grasp domain-containing protein [Streptomyces gobiensis]